MVVKGEYRGIWAKERWEDGRPSNGAASEINMSERIKKDNIAYKPDIEKINKNIQRVKK